MRRVVAPVAVGHEQQRQPLGVGEPDGGSPEALDPALDGQTVLGEPIGPPVEIGDRPDAERRLGERAPALGGPGAPGDIE